MLGHAVCRLGQDLQCPVVITHHPLACRQFVQGGAKLLGLRDCEIADVLELVVLPNEEALTCGAAQPGERLRAHERKRRGEQGIEHSRNRRRRVLFDAQESGDTGGSWKSVLDSFDPKDRSRRPEYLIERSPRQENAPRFAIDEQREELQKRGVAASIPLKYAERFCIVRTKL